jgi:hypothetical protein
MLVRPLGLAGFTPAIPPVQVAMLLVYSSHLCFRLVAMISNSPSLAPGIQSLWWLVPGCVLLGDFPGECEVREYPARDKPSGRGLCAPGGGEYRLEIRRARPAEEFRSRGCISGTVYHNMTYRLGMPLACASRENPGHAHRVEPTVEADDLRSEEK